MRHPLLEKYDQSPCQIEKTKILQYSCGPHIHLMTPNFEYIFITNQIKSLVLSIVVLPLIQTSIIPSQINGEKSSQRLSISSVLMVFYVLKKQGNKSSLFFNIHLSSVIFDLKFKRSVLLMTSKIIMILSTTNFHAHL